LQLAALYDDVREVEEMDFERVEHAFASDDDLLGLFFDGEGPNQSGHFLGCEGGSQLQTLSMNIARNVAEI